MKKRMILAVLLCGTYAQAQIVDKNFEGSKGSVWNDENGNPLMDRTARREGDIITVLISESSVASYAANTNTTKQDSNKVSLDLLNNIVSRLIRPWNSNDSSANSGGGTSTQNSKLTAKLTAVVKKVMPNGTLLIEGSRSVVVNRETQTFKLSGVIRRDDVKSDKIAEADIRLEGKGAIYDRNRRGLLTRILDWLF
jgi:flagellar L-ring protein precursor FlgH